MTGNMTANLAALEAQRFQLMQELESIGEEMTSLRDRLGRASIKLREEGKWSHNDWYRRT
jgi:hypothetical protein